MAKHKVLSNDEDIRNVLAESASESEDSIVSAVSLQNLNGLTSIIIKMSDGSIHGIPKSKLEGLAEAPEEVLRNVEITEDGLGLRWPQIDLDLYVPALLQGIYGTKTWMSSLGKLGGRARSEAKRNAARLNGRKGGRPRKQAVVPAMQASATSQSHEIRLRAKRPGVDPFRDSAYRLPSKFSKVDFAVLFGLDAFATPRALPRIS